ncbi:unnamed protein product, partial [Mesorhabditis belari]|uniref:Uncharacterized protein n=1 Tax=Mesorhabditis belari TaxID=2138241 RepID=A0AAF3FL74_9BILA
MSEGKSLTLSIFLFAHIDGFFLPARRNDALLSRPLSPNHSSNLHFVGGAAARIGAAYFPTPPTILQLSTVISPHFTHAKSRLNPSMGIDFEPLSGQWVAIITSHVHDYSAVALLPVAVVVCLVIAVAALYQCRRCRHHRKQIEQLAWVYDVLEDALPSPLPVQRQHSKPPTPRAFRPPDSPQLSPAQRVSQAVRPPPAHSSPFFQPACKGRALRYDNFTKATSATEVIFHFTSLLDENSTNSIEQHV